MQRFLLCTVALMVSTSTSSAETPLTTFVSREMAFDGRLERNGATICEISVSQPDQFWTRTGTGCRVDLSDPTPIRIFGDLKGHVSGRVDRSFQPFDLAPWTHMIHESSLPFDERIERHWQSVKDLYGPVPDWEAELYGNDIKKKFLRDNDWMNARWLWGVDQSAFASNAADRNHAALDALNTQPLTQYMLNNGWTEGASIMPRIPSKGTDERAFYDRVLFLHDIEGDGYDLVVWDPAANADEPSFLRLEADDHRRVPYVHFDGRRFEINDLLQGAFTGAWNYGYLSEEDAKPWMQTAAQSAGFDPKNPDVFFADSSNPNGILTLTFEQGRTIPLMRTAIPELRFSGEVWSDYRDAEVIWNP